MLPKAGDIDKLLSLSVEKRNVLLSLPPDGMQSLVVSCPLLALDTLAAQMYPPPPPRIIAQDVVECEWIDKQPIAVVPTTMLSPSLIMVVPTASTMVGTN